MHMHSQQNRIPREHEMMKVDRIGGGIEQNSHSTQSCHDFCEHPFSVCCFAAAMEVDAIETCDGESHHELEEAKSAASDGAGETTVAGRDGGEHVCI